MYPVNYVNLLNRRTIVRPANVTAYALGQVIASGTSSNLVFPASVGGRGGYITRVLLTTNRPAHTEALRLHLFNNPPASVADQAVLNLAAITESTYEGFVDFTSFVSTGTSYVVSEGSLASRPLQFNTGVNNELIGVIETRAAFTPVSAQSFAIKVYTEYSS